MHWNGLRSHHIKHTKCQKEKSHESAIPDCGLWIERSRNPRACTRHNHQNVHNIREKTDVFIRDD